jgi:hypothetical protein
MQKGSNNECMQARFQRTKKDCETDGSELGLEGLADEATCPTQLMPTLPHSRHHCAAGLPKPQPGEQIHTRVAMTWRVFAMQHIREEKLLQLLLWKMVHFALFLVKISINFRPSYSTVFFPTQWMSSTLQKFQNFSTMF